MVGSSLSSPWQRYYEKRSRSRSSTPLHWRLASRALVKMRDADWERFESKKQRAFNGSKDEGKEDHRDGDRDSEAGEDQHWKRRRRADDRDRNGRDDEEEPSWQRARRETFEREEAKSRRRDRDDSPPFDRRGRTRYFHEEREERHRDPERRTAPKSEEERHPGSESYRRRDDERDFRRRSREHARGGDYERPFRRRDWDRPAEADEGEIGAARGHDGRDDEFDRGHRRSSRKRHYDPRHATPPDNDEKK